jgi:DNA-directed RNA polymerase subunit RPC12/RpoP
MAVITAIRCPECEKQFKPKAEVRGKKIKCPFCAHPFVAPLPKNPAKPKTAKEPAAKAKQTPEDSSPAPVEPVRNEFDADPDPYGVKNQDLAPRCPYCAQELPSANAIICLHCGYNNLTREVGKTKKLIGLSFDRHLKYLLPALGAAAFSFFSVIFLLFYAIVSPSLVAGVAILQYSDHESLRMWCTVIFLMWIYFAGLFCFKKFIDQPKPDDIAVD